jgi:hypothetical protein
MKLIPRNNTHLLLLVTALIVMWVAIYNSLHKVSDFIVNLIPGLTPGSSASEAIRFFVFEVPKVFMLLILIIFIVGIIRT